jgi:hypothetical protein
MKRHELTDGARKGVGGFYLPVILADDPIQRSLKPNRTPRPASSGDPCLAT